ncbi:hypothetical protein CR513_09550, partial [Mucuna pruriens]
MEELYHYTSMDALVYQAIKGVPQHETEEKNVRYQVQLQHPKAVAQNASSTWRKMILREDRNLDNGSSKHELLEIRPTSTHPMMEIFSWLSI